MWVKSRASQVQGESSPGLVKSRVSQVQALSQVHGLTQIQGIFSIYSYCNMGPQSTVWVRFWVLYMAKKNSVSQVQGLSQIQGIVNIYFTL